MIKNVGKKVSLFLIVVLACCYHGLPTIHAFISPSNSRVAFVPQKHDQQHNTKQVQMNSRMIPTTCRIRTTRSTLEIVRSSQEKKYYSSSSLYAGGFAWEDPTETIFDQGVDNPYKNPDLLVAEDSTSTSEGGVGMKIDAARLLSPRLNGSNLYFIGIMGSGKSSIAKIVAKRMGSYTFLDTDEIIEKVTGMTIPDIFAKEGEGTFRDVEGQVLNSVYAYVRCVISTGGGIVCRRENWSKLQSGVVVWLDVDPEIIIKRIEGTDRPLLQTSNPLQTLQQVLNDRKEMYEQADIRIEITDPNEQADDVAERIIRDIHNYIDDNPPAWKQAKAKAQADGLDWVQ